MVHKQKTLKVQVGLFLQALADTIKMLSLQNEYDISALSIHMSDRSSPSDNISYMEMNKNIPLLDLNTSKEKFNDDN